MKKLKVLTVVGTRPEIIRLSRIIAKLDIYCCHVLVHTGQNFDHQLSQVFFDELGIREPDFHLGVSGMSPAKTVGNIMIALDDVLDDVKPDAMLVLGDTNSCLSVIAAKRKKIPIFHMEAGNRCFDMRVPEEINRRVVDHVSDVNLTYSQIGREYLLSEGLPADLIIKTNSPLREVLTFYNDKILTSNILEKLNLFENKFFVVSVHREENVDSEEVFARFVVLINSIADIYKMPIVVSTHPRIRAKVRSHEGKINELIQFHQPFGFFDYIKLQLSAKTVLSDSGTITEEASILGFPAINLRETHERPEGMEEGAVMMVGFNQDRTLQALAILEGGDSGNAENINPVVDYEAENVSEKIVRIIHSYTDYVNRVVWKKY